jgi:Fe-S-cluster formation regulator IscX/YfhJ
MKTRVAKEDTLPVQLQRATELVCENLNTLNQLQLELMRLHTKLNIDQIDQLLMTLSNFKQVENKSSEKILNVIAFCKNDENCLNFKDKLKFSLLKDMISEKRQAYSQIVNRLLDLRNMSEG